MTIEFIDGFATESGEALVFFYDQATGAYCGSGFVPVSEGCGLAPGQSLIRPPDAKPGFSAQWSGDAWQMVEDHRGLCFQTADGAAVEHTQLGPLPEGLTSEPRPTPAHRWDAGVWVFDEVLEKQNREEAVSELTREVDIAADSARERLCGGVLRASEYQLTTDEALAFRDNGYPDDDVPRSIASAVTASKTAQQAADEVLAAAARCQEYLQQIREIRLGAKALIRAQLVDGKHEEALRLVTDTHARFEALN
jgi:hypothetical protein